MNRKPPLATAELAVMKLLWQKGDLTAREILEELYPDSTKSQHGTVQRLLQRLEEKSFVKRDRTSPVQRFAARVGQEEYLGSELENLAEQLTGGSLTPLLTFLIEGKKLSRAEIKRLKRLVEEK